MSNQVSGWYFLSYQVSDISYQIGIFNIIIKIFLSAF